MSDRSRRPPAGPALLLTACQGGSTAADGEPGVACGVPTAG